MRFWIQLACSLCISVVVSKPALVSANDCAQNFSSLKNHSPILSADFTASIYSSVNPEANQRIRNFIVLCERRKFANDELVSSIERAIEVAANQTKDGMYVQAFRVQTQSTRFYGRVERTGERIKIIVSTAIVDDLPYNSNVEKTDLRFAKMLFALMKASDSLFQKSGSTTSLSIVAEDVANDRLKTLLESLGMKGRFNRSWEIKKTDLN